MTGDAPAYKTYDFVLPAGTEMAVEAAGEWVTCLSADHEYFGLSIDDLPFSDFARGFRFGGGFTRLRLKNQSATLPLHLKMAVGIGEFVDARSVSAGPRSVVGSLGIVNAPLTTEGGSITPVGASVIGLSLVNTVPATDVMTEVVSAAANVNGLVLRTGNIDFQKGGTVSSAKLIAGPDSLKRQILLANPRNVFAEITREIYIPPGLELRYSIYVPTGGVTAEAFAFLTYDIL